MSPVRRLFCCLILMSFALSLHASVPATRSVAHPSGDQTVQPVFNHNRAPLMLTAAPADVSFYEEFYPAATVRPEQPPKTSVLHWFGNLIKKAVRR